MTRHSLSRSARRTGCWPISAGRRSGAARNTARTPRTGPAGSGCADPSLAMSGQIAADRPTVYGLHPGPGETGDRPTLATQCVHVVVVLPCERERRGSRDLVSGQMPPASRESRTTRRSHTRWGVSTSRSGEFQISVIRNHERPYPARRMERATRHLADDGDNLTEIKVGASMVPAAQLAGVQGWRRRGRA
jgi:hypothetical protein